MIESPEQERQKGWCENCGQEASMVTVISKDAEKSYCIKCGKVCMIFFSGDAGKESAAMVLNSTSAESRETGIAFVLGKNRADSELILDNLSNERDVKRGIICEDGADLISKFSNALIQSVKVDFVVIDSPRGPLGAASAARAVRAVEHSFRKKNRALIILGGPIDEHAYIQAAVADCQPAEYLERDAFLPLTAIPNLI